MGTTAYQTQRLLHSNHLDDLRGSGLSPETIERSGCYSITDPQGMHDAGFAHLKPPALALPIAPPDRVTLDLNDVMLKPDKARLNKNGRSAKYEVRPNSRNRIHVPLVVRDKLADVSIPLVITEGWKKAEKAAQDGICTIALAGVWNWKDRVGESSFPIGDFDLIPLAGRCIFICFDSDAVSNRNVRQAERDLAAFLRKRFGAKVSIKRLPPGFDNAKVGLDDFLLTHSAQEFWALPAQELDGPSATTWGDEDWPDPSSLGDELPPVEICDLGLLPASLRPLVEDVSELMQTPIDYAAVGTLIALAGCVNRRALIQPKARDTSWSVVPNLWGGIVAPPGFMKSPMLRAITRPLTQIEELWRAEHEQELSEYELSKEQAELELQAWKENCKQAFKKHTEPPLRPDKTLTPPAHRRLLVTDPTYEKLHEILSENPAGVLMVRDELTGWLAGLERQGREQERAFYLESWNGDSPFTIDRIGRGSIHVPAVCVSLIGNIQPARLRWYLSDALGGGRNDDGLFQRFQLLVWPDPPREWKLIDRPPNRHALAMAEQVYTSLANRSADDPIRMHFDPDAQQLFYEWLADIENRVRGDHTLAPPLVGHLAKFRSLLPSLAGLFELADRAAGTAPLSGEIAISLVHTQQAAAFCDYLQSHAQRVYSCVISPETRAARELARHIQANDLSDEFATRTVYLKGWAGLDTPERVRGALVILEDAGWLHRIECPSSPTGGRPSESWLVNPKVARHEK